MTSVVIDRGVGVGLLIAIGFGYSAALCLPASRLSADTAKWCWAFTAAMLLVAALGLVLAPTVCSMAVSVAIFPLVSDLGSGRASRTSWPVRPDDLGHRMPRSSPYHRRHLVAGTRAR